MHRAVKNNLYRGKQDRFGRRCLYLSYRYYDIFEELLLILKVSFRFLCLFGFGTGILLA